MHGDVNQLAHWVVHAHFGEAAIARFCLCVALRA
jgi:hypothetical protein